MKQSRIVVLIDFGSSAGGGSQVGAIALIINFSRIALRRMKDEYYHYLFYQFHLSLHIISIQALTGTSFHLPNQVFFFTIQLHPPDLEAPSLGQW
jgi:hypothetical protein